MRSGRSGFTLIEVTIALAIFAVTAVVISQSFLTGIFSLEAFRFIDRDVEREQELLRYVLSVQEREQLENGGEFSTYDNYRVKWEAGVEVTDLLDLFKVDLSWEIADSKETDNRVGEEDFYVLRPGWMNEAERAIILGEKRGRGQS